MDFELKTLTPHQAANQTAEPGPRIGEDRAVPVTVGTHLGDASEVAELVIGLRNGQPVYLSDVASIRQGGDQPTRYVWHQPQGRPSTPAVTLAIAKQPGRNAADITGAIARRVEALRGTVIPDGVHVEITRDYGQTATDKAQKLIQKLVFATLSVVLLVLATLGRREAIFSAGLSVGLSLAIAGIVRGLLTAVSAL